MFLPFGIATDVVSSGYIRRPVQLTSAAYSRVELLAFAVCKVMGRDCYWLTLVSTVSKRCPCRWRAGAPQAASMPRGLELSPHLRRPGRKLSAGRA